MSLSKRTQLIDELILRNSQQTKKAPPQEEVMHAPENESQEHKFNVLVSRFNDKEKKSEKDKKSNIKAFIKYFTENFETKIDNKLFT